GAPFEPSRIRSFGSPGRERRKGPYPRCHPGADMDERGGLFEYRKCLYRHASQEGRRRIPGQADPDGSRRWVYAAQARRGMRGMNILPASFADAQHRLRTPFGSVRAQLILWNVVSLSLLLGGLGLASRFVTLSFMMQSVDRELDRGIERF